MWDDKKRRRFEELRTPDRSLNEAEKGELAALVKELEESEATYLGPVNNRLAKENERAEAKRDELAKLAERKAALAQRLQTVLSEVRMERQAIEQALAAVLGADQGDDSDQ
jgi:hypothetical protein